MTKTAVHKVILLQVS